MKRAFLVSSACLIFTLASQAETITGSWKVTWILIEHDMAYSINAPITLTIDENGKIHGSGGCNTFSGNHSLKRSLGKSFRKPRRIRLTNIVATRIACDLKTGPAENAFFRSLREATTVLLKDGELQLESARIGNWMTFVRESEPKP